MLRAAAHLAANGNRAGLLFFGTFMVFAACAPMLVNRRGGGGEEAWRRFAAASPALPFAGPGPVDWKGIGWRPLPLGLALYASVMLIHEWIIGVRPWP